MSEPAAPVHAAPASASSGQSSEQSSHQSSESRAAVHDDAMLHDRAALGGLLAAQTRRKQLFADPQYEWRRLFAEVFGTFLLVLVGAGGGVVAAKYGGIDRAAAVTAPGLLVASVILSIGGVSGAHLNPVVSVAFALRRDFPWKRVPGYIVAQLVGATLACLVLWALFGDVGHLGATLPGPHVTGAQAFGIEALLTMGLVGTILGSASGAQNVGPLSALAVGSYIILSGLWSSPVSGAVMNPARAFGPDLARWDFHDFWPYLAGPSMGALAAVGIAFVLRGPSGTDVVASRAAQGSLSPAEAAATAAAPGSDAVRGA